MPLTIKTYGRTDKGLVRPGNEDCLHLDEGNHVYAVCDGMGGHQAGEVASMTAVETLIKAHEYFRDELLDDSALALNRLVPQSGDLLVRAIRLANRAIYNAALIDASMSGMGTTVVALAFEAAIVSIAHVGDSRAYRLEERSLVPLTRDHSWVAEIQQQQHISAEEASSVVGKNVITRALGVREGVEVDYRIAKVQAGDVFFLCSDGLCGYADDDEIFEVAIKHRHDLRQLVDNLIQMANDRGGSDNVTVVAVEVVDISPSPLPELEVITFPVENPGALEAEDRWAEEFRQVVLDAEADGETSGGANTWLLFGIFALFAVVAVVIIWMQFD